ncbi:hypothetical protein CDAR_54691 [Caerostris darwini]|uniref:LAGLIDADG homing endonuclease n=1 Tax=Caerostris darwini TaxID=1538125 RepID=A0AAV4S217_9ARAC|nr:hypothetical protein CDAR_54691 [Caerostris darwini]
MIKCKAFKSKTPSGISSNRHTLLFAYAKNPCTRFPLSSVLMYHALVHEMDLGYFSFHSNERDKNKKCKCVRLSPSANIWSCSAVPGLVRTLFVWLGEYKDLKKMVCYIFWFKI